MDVGEESGELRSHIESTYNGLRLGIGVIGLALPIALWVGGLIRQSISLRASMSGYYYTPMRDVFVGSLCAVGVSLYLYKGFSKAENNALNAAGMFAVGVAMFPTRSTAAWTSASYLHLACAILFFLCLAYVCVFRASDTLNLIRDTKRALMLRRWYRSLGMAMVVSPLGALVTAQILRPRSGEASPIFFIEAFGAWAFGAYWLLKTWELRQTNAESAAAQGILVPALPSTAGAVELPGKLVQVAPLDESVEELRQRVALD